ncbi:carbohydrate porin [Burkholderia multivorans]|uniref:carbohydrate porin n=1 Tax=Burkholderia multivorans TaxID=87883 RepID=UPI001C2742DB|nr:carbohydrate porin [Burkholderia multivorans]MBU9598395.1 carbohydrate porin [Burkholderia multivorans]
MSPKRFGVSGYRHSVALRLLAMTMATMPASSAALAQATGDAAAVGPVSAKASASAPASTSAASAPPGIVQGSGDPLKQVSTDRPAVHQGIPSTDDIGVSHIGNATSEPPESPRKGPLSSIGQKMNDWGFTPVFNLVQMYLANPGVGQQTGKHEALTFVSVGGDFDLQKIAGLTGATIHFQQLFVPFTSNLGWGTQAGDVLAGQPGPYVPKVSHLALFTWEQKAFDNKLDLEVGKSNPGLYFGAPVCNQGFGCQSAILQRDAGMNPPIYVNWGGRVRYNLTPEWSMQAGVWRSNPAFPFTNGWEWTDSVPDSNTWLANVAYRTTYQSDPYPKSFELMFYYNTAAQTDPLTAGRHKGTSGLYFGGRQVVYRPDGGKAGEASPTALSVFGTATASLDSHSSTGIAMTGSAGLILEAPFRSRPHDSYSLSLNWATLTPHEQAYLREQNLVAGGTGYTVGRTQYGLKLDANVSLTRSVILSPYVMRTWNTSTWGNPVYAGTPKNGFVVGVLVSIFFDKMLGLTDH